MSFWKEAALFALGKISEQTNSAQTALEDYRKAIEIIESVRAGLRFTSLRTDFLADKRDVYDSQIALQLQQPASAVDDAAVLKSALSPSLSPDAWRSLMASSASRMAPE